jgi:hypothetical protein
VACISSCVQFYTDPAAVRRTAIGKNLSGSIDDLWNMAYGAAGLFILYGVLRRHGRAEIIGQLFLLAGLLPNVIAIGITIGGGPSFWVLIAAALASMGRIYFLQQTALSRR